MSENVSTPVETPETPGTGSGVNTPIATGSTSWINLAVEETATLINAMKPFANITRGALGSGNSLCCEIAPSNAQEVYLDKNAYFTITLAINGKHDNMQTLSDTLNNIMDTLTRLTAYPSGTGWEIVDITNGTMPRIIGRESDNRWLMACDLVIKIYRKDDN